MKKNRLMTMNCRSNRDDAMYSLPRKEEKIDLYYRVMSQLIQKVKVQ